MPRFQIQPTYRAMAFSAAILFPALCQAQALPLPAQSPPQPPPAQPVPVAKPEQPKNVEQVTVTAYRAPLGVLESPVTTRVLTEQSLRSTAAITFDDRLRQLPGVELFRRSPSLVANPTS
ncbi:MAG TPA: hypothetical protein VGG45_19390, partial [Terracidiphilus sp.]